MAASTSKLRPKAQLLAKVASPNMPLQLVVGPVLGPGTNVLLYLVASQFLAPRYTGTHTLKFSQSMCALSSDLSQLKIPHPTPCSGSSC